MTEEHTTSAEPQTDIVGIHVGEVGSGVVGLEVVVVVLASSVHVIFMVLLLMRMSTFGFDSFAIQIRFATLLQT